MTGAVISRPETRHECDPGVTWAECTAHTGDAPDVVMCPMDRPHLYAILPTPWAYPAGTVWECDCGLRWVSQGSPAINAPGMCTWRLEAFARLRRARRRRAAIATPSPTPHTEQES